MSRSRVRSRLLACVSGTAATVAGLVLVPLYSGATSPLPSYRVLFVGPTAANGGVYGTDATDAVTEVLTDPSVDVTAVSATSDTQRFAFAERKADGTRWIGVLPTSGNGYRYHVVSTYADTKPRWAADGRRLVFATGTPTPHLALTNRLLWDAVSDNAGAVTDIPGTAGMTYAVFNPADDTLLAQQSTGLVHITTTGALASAVSFPAGAGDPSYSANGLKVTYTIPDPSSSGDRLVYVADADGSNPVQLDTPAAVYANGPVFTPDGTTVYFSTWEPGVQVATLYRTPASGAAGYEVAAGGFTRGYSPTVVPRDATPPYISTGNRLGVELNGAHPFLQQTPIGGDPTYESGNLLCWAEGYQHIATPAGCTNISAGFGPTVIPGHTYTFAWFPFDTSGNVPAPAVAHFTAWDAPRMSTHGPLSSFSTGPNVVLGWGGLLPPGAGDWQFKLNNVEYRVQSTVRSQTYTVGSSNGQLVPGHRYDVRVRLNDDLDGHQSIWGPVTHYDVPLDETIATYGAGWTKVTPSSRWLATLHGTHTAGAALTVTLTGKTLSIVGDKCAGCGAFRVYQGSTLLATVDTRASTTLVRQVLWSRTFTTNAARTLKVVAVGTAGRPQVNVDAFVAAP